MPRPKPNVYLSPSLFVEMGHVAIHLNISRGDAVARACNRFLEMIRDQDERAFTEAPIKLAQPKQLRYPLESTIGRRVVDRDELTNDTKKVMREIDKLMREKRVELGDGK